MLIIFCLTANAGRRKYDGADCQDATLISNLVNSCTGAAAYSTTASQPIYWFKFTPAATDISITVTGQTLGTPTIQLFTDCTGNLLSGSSSTAGNQTTYYKGGLLIGHTYYVAVGSGNNQPGSFQFCINNFNPVLQAGQDFATAGLLCSTQTFSQGNVSGAGLNNMESAGTCLSEGAGVASEQNSVWYKWQAANNGTLVFTLIPNSVTDDLDFVVYDIGTNGNDATKINAANAIRCAAGHGFCAVGPNYYKTGLDFAATDFSEPSGCDQGQDGKVQYITMQQGHYYALLVNNFTSRGNAFTVAFTDQNGVAGTGQFVGPTAAITTAGSDTCSINPKFVFGSSSAGYSSLKWHFGDGASIDSAATAGPFTVTYATPGVKTVTLAATSPQGCVAIDYKTITVVPKAALAAITINKPLFCIGDTLKLSVANQAGFTYHWAGPGNYTADTSAINIPLTAATQAGQYFLTRTRSACTYADSVTVPAIYAQPQAAFYTYPTIPARLSVPISISFFNQSVNADSFLWDFGDGSTSTDKNPAHNYTVKGTYKVTLTAFQHTACSASVTRGDYILLDAGAIFVSNAFTPNGDGIDDVFTIGLTNLGAYHLKVFNRYGVQLFESQSLYNNWDGTYNGLPVPAGVYYYVITATSLDNQPVKRSGYVAVIR